MDNLANASQEALPVNFSREGQDADFLWLSDSSSSSRRAWESFPGVYGFLPVRGIKPGATLYACLHDSRLGDSEKPPYFVGQFYGSGSVFYMGSGEAWRLRAVDDNYFNQFYTKLIRHVSQGRLLRGSRRGVLLVGQDRYVLGNSIEIRAQLTDGRLEPLNSPGGVTLQIITPEGGVQSLVLQPDATRQGTFRGQFPALQEGSYRLELPVPESDNERLTRRVQVKVPELERENPQRNDQVLGKLAVGGQYYVGIDSILHGKQPLAGVLKDRTTTFVQPESHDAKAEEPWFKWMMIALCSLLCLEWLIRRLVKLA
jgi:hypothetical protein